ncbi:MAG: hypothetical protein ACK526_23180 [Planctomyces sp.]
MLCGRTFVQLLVLSLLPVVCIERSDAGEWIDLRQAEIAAPDAGRIFNTAQRVLTEEIARRTGITLPSAEDPFQGQKPSILLCLAGQAPAHLSPFIDGMNVPKEAESFSVAIYSKATKPVVVLAGRDDRGVLYAVGWLLLQLKMKKQILELPADTHISTAPRYPHRGHQIGYRSLAHCYDAWTPAMYEQYMRELAVFGANGFETTGFDGGPLARVTGPEMAAAWARICSDYGFDFWLFSTAIGGEGKSAREEDEAIAEGMEMIREIPQLDHIYLTGGDGGTSHARPDLMFETTRRFAVEARKINPDLGIWVSNQGFGPEQNNWFFDYLQREQPEWVTGVVYGAWSRILPDEQRARVPAKYPIRLYPDIGHCIRSQYPVPGWDRALAQTLGREPYAPRPRGHANIHNLYDQYADGFLTYSDGVGDDVNKFVWTALGWNPDRDLNQIMLDYARFFFGWDIAERVREGLFGLEDAFTGPLAANTGVEKNFAIWKSLEDEADDTLLSNWRFQECLLRAYYDHYTRLRLIRASSIEERAIAALEQASLVGVEKAIASARTILAESDQDETTAALRARIMELGKELFDSIGAQLDVANYKAKNPERGAVLDFLDTPLNNRLWIEDELDAILTGRFTATMPESVSSENDVRLARLSRVVKWENPGPGSFYDDLGCAWKQPRLVKPRTLWEDPAGITTPREGHTQVNLSYGAARLSWLDHSEALNATPLVMHYEGLDPEASYRVRVTYLGRYLSTIRLVADEKFEIHGAYGHTVRNVRFARGPSDRAADITSRAAEVTSEDADSVQIVTPLEFVIPREATTDGILDLQWQRLTGRGAEVAEVWLIKQPS